MPAQASLGEVGEGAGRAKTAGKDPCPGLEARRTAPYSTADRGIATLHYI